MRKRASVSRFQKTISKSIINNGECGLLFVTAGQLRKLFFKLLLVKKFLLQKNVVVENLIFSV